jgi:peptidase E
VVHVQSDYKLCEGLHKFIGKNVITTKELNENRCKEKPKRFFFIPYASSSRAPFFALHTSRLYLTSCQTFGNKGWSVFAVAVLI